MRQEYQVYESDEDQLFDQSFLQRISGAVDKLGSVIEWNDLNASWQAGFDLFDLFLDILDRFKRAHAITHDHNAADRFFAAQAAQDRRLRYTELPEGLAA